MAANQSKLMDNELEERIRYHSYPSNPTLDNYLCNRRHQNDEERIIVRERRPSGVSISSVHSYNDDQTDHQRCITPAPQEPYDLMCVICHNLAINPFQCSRVGQTNNNGTVYESSGQHLCCYQCIAQYMIINGTDSFLCPYCRINQFSFNDLSRSNEHIIQESENYIIYCPNNCGLMGSPNALAHHICPLQSKDVVGHTLMSGIVSKMMSANTNINQELMALKEQYSQMETDFNEEKVRSEVNNNIIKKLRRRTEEMDGMIKRLQSQKSSAVRNLMKLGRAYRKNIDEKQECISRLKEEINELIALAVTNETRDANRESRSRSGSAHSEMSSDDPSLGLLFATPPLTNTTDNEP